MNKSSDNFGCFQVESFKFERKFKTAEIFPLKSLELLWGALKGKLVSWFLGNNRPSNIPNKTSFISKLLERPECSLGKLQSQ